MRASLSLLTIALGCWASCASAAAASKEKVCSLRPLGHGRDDTDQVEAAIAKCGHFGTTVFAPGQYNITRKMTWDLVSSRVDLHGSLNFKPDIAYWLDPANTYRVIFIQSQASWFVLTGRDFTVDAHNAGGIAGNGQAWWSFFANRTRADGDGRPVALTLSNVTRGVVRDFRVEGQPFWCNAVADSSEVVYDGMYCNATNADPVWAGQNIVPNTDGINTYRSDKISLLRFDITSGDDCLAIKGNSTNIFAKDITCRGGNGIAIGSLGQYAGLPDIVDNLVMEDLKLIRLDPQVQPNMVSGVYLKTWTGSVHGAPPTGGGGGGGFVSNVVAKGVSVDRVTVPIHLYQTNGGGSGDTPSSLQFSNLTFSDWTGTSLRNTIVDVECSPAVPCPNIRFENVNIAPPNGTAASFKCINVASEFGLPACNATGAA
ncbi:pectin lyase-like protein [Trametes versicolor FP-101664 SS1]|uniref:pectin lyase-like protein n=1 Tax=Trametes versicolor (strain FP-101664) TaxID=717944 RepID=UPI0004622E0A|nr:pectin lyase-like protein [Trametes versicolor FP-101664 SS1]EIW52205.1 pectin lyase-like protein [Trametes versicolor FP-101664 SS1]